MDLLCGEVTPDHEEVDMNRSPKYNQENIVGTTKAAEDNNVLKDNRALNHLLCSESRYIPKCVFASYRRNGAEVEPHMRKILTNWMLEVCEELRCEEVVFPLAINYIDRLMSCTKIRKCQLQLVGAVCLLIASKLRQCDALTPDVLSYFTDYSVTTQEILGWELLVLARLKWDVSAVVATDFLNHLLVRLELNNEEDNESTIKNRNMKTIIRRHASTFIALCATELQFACHSPSLVACASIATAMHGLDLLQTQWKSFDKIVFNLREITGIEETKIHSCVDQIESLIKAS
ncbi:unnamed protein product, partial [Sphagnum balticum]